MKNKNKNFKIIFKKLEVLKAEEKRDGKQLKKSDFRIDPIEFDEINELRKLSAEISQPYPYYFTRT